MKVIFVYGQGAFWHAVFENGEEISGFLEYEEALTARYDESKAQRRSPMVSSKHTYTRCDTLT